MSEKRDYYEVLGVAQARHLRRHPQGLPASRAEEPPRSQPRRLRGGRSLQRGDRGLPGPLRRRQTRPLRPVRPRRPRGDARPRRRHLLPLPGHLLRVLRRLRRRWAAASTRRSGARSGPSASSSASRSRTPSSAASARSRCARPSLARSAAARGAKPGTKRKQCATCGGVRSGVDVARLRHVHPDVPRVRGRGLRREDAVRRRATAHGAVEKTRKVLVTFPAGIDGGQRLRVPGQGMPGAQGGPPGDLYVDVELAPDERFERDGLDLITRASSRSPTRRWAASSRSTCPTTPWSPSTSPPAPSRARSSA